jgi:hypothetical protein
MDVRHVLDNLRLDIERMSRELLLTFPTATTQELAERVDLQLSLGLLHDRLMHELNTDEVVVDYPQFRYYDNLNIIRNLITRFLNRFQRDGTLMNNFDPEHPELRPERDINALRNTYNERDELTLQMKIQEIQDEMNRLQTLRYNLRYGQQEQQHLREAIQEYNAIINSDDVGEDDKNQALLNKATALNEYRQYEYSAYGFGRIDHQRDILHLLPDNEV